MFLILMSGKVSPCLTASSSLSTLSCFPIFVPDPQWTAVQEQSKGLITSAESPYTDKVQSRGSSEAGDIVLCMPNNVKENKSPVKKEGSKTMAELQVRFTFVLSSPETHLTVISLFSQFQLHKQQQHLPSIFPDILIVFGAIESLSIAACAFRTCTLAPNAMSPIFMLQCLDARVSECVCMHLCLCIIYP